MASGLNNGTRLFRGCRTLLDSLKSTTQAYSSAAAVSPKGELKASGAAATRKKSEAGEKKEGNRSGGIFKSVQVSPALAGFLGMSESSRSEAVKQIWSYIKLNDLQNPANKRQINCDEKLKAIFDGRENVGILEIGKLLSPHFVKSSS
ncbi:upstream activation factor subunit spp27-like [Cucurbita maxima]|uniref:Upstream activation factor subunit spp27-like n=1 Tax=Cucurbita maxima TaxID=3661 RepID=A0A6J1KEZ2_CUCMA|nr:upstream activation factor subunit spp27-like [Cucurbita maxima]